MNEEDNKKSSFVEHLTELRSRLVKSIIYLFIFFIVCYFFAENIYSFLVAPYAEAVKDDGINRRMIFTALHETFITYLKVTLANFRRTSQTLKTLLEMRCLLRKI